MGRGRGVLSAVLLMAALAEALLQASYVFVGQSVQPAPLGAEHAVARRAKPMVTWTIDPESERKESKADQFDEKDLDDEEEELGVARMPLPDNGIHLDGDKLDNLEEWYQEQLTGEGGSPDGFIRDLILKSFYAPYNPKITSNNAKAGWFLPQYVMYTGEHGLPCDTDYETAFENMKTNIKENKNYQMKDDGLGWTWIVASANPGGQFLYTTKSPPYGERPLALIKQDDPDEFFEKIDWHRLYIRLHKWQLWGGKAKGFPYLVRGKPVLS